MKCIPVGWLKGEVADAIFEKVAKAAGDDGLCCYDEYVEVDKEVAPLMEGQWVGSADRYKHLLASARDRETEATDKLLLGMVSDLLKEGKYSRAAAVASLVSDAKLLYGAYDEIAEKLAGEDPRGIAEAIEDMAPDIEEDVQFVSEAVMKTLIKGGREQDARGVAFEFENAMMRDMWRALLVYAYIHDRRFDDASIIAYEVENEAARQSFVEEISLFRCNAAPPLPEEGD